VGGGSDHVPRLGWVAPRGMNLPQRQNGPLFSSRTGSGTPARIGRHCRRALWSDVWGRRPRGGPRRVTRSGTSFRVRATDTVRSASTGPTPVRVTASRDPARPVSNTPESPIPRQKGQSTWARSSRKPSPAASRPPARFGARPCRCHGPRRAGDSRHVLAGPGEPKRGIRRRQIVRPGAESDQGDPVRAGTSSPASGPPRQIAART